MYAKLIIVGNLGGDPTMRYLPDGTPVTNFSVAVNRRWNNADGTPGEETIWFRCTAWRKTAEVVNQYLAKGRQVLVEGRLNSAPTARPARPTKSRSRPSSSWAARRAATAPRPRLPSTKKLSRSKLQRPKGKWGICPTSPFFL
jgi:single-stranded DNA-binding protein